MLFSFFFLLLILGVSGCVPGASSDANPATTTPVLPERPSTQSEIFNRDLLFKNDPRISYCEMIENRSSTYSGMRDTQLEPLASLSKVITTAWALEKLGGDFRFQTEIFLSSVSANEGTYDVYLKTNLDPIVNIEKLLFFISKMKQAGVLRIRNLVIDEDTRIFLGVLSNPHIELAHTPVSTEETLENLNLILNSKNWAEKTKLAQSRFMEWARRNNTNLILPEQFSVARISYKPSREINTSAYPSKLILSSAPLFKYLKNVNVHSNNYISDALFTYLGGTTGFKKFQKNSLHLTDKELKVFTGSGLSESAMGVRQDNLGTCFSMIKVLSFLKAKAAQINLNLGALLLNPSKDKDGTFDTSTDYQNAAVLKTGRLYEVPAMNLAGFVSTRQGVLSFVFLGHDFSDSEASEIESTRQRMMDDIFSQFSVRQDFGSIEYLDIFF